MRKVFHRQLKELWQQHPDLRRLREQFYVVHTTPPNLVSWPGPNVRQIIEVPQGQAQFQAPNAKNWLDHIAEDHIVDGHRFAPLVSVNGGFTCALDILFLRRDDPGDLVESGGDIDNRIKVLLDGLRMPKNPSEFGGLPIESDEDPFHCVLEDDKLITSMSVVTDRLITPPQPHEHPHDVVLVIGVTVVNSSQLFAGGRLL